MSGSGGIAVARTTRTDCGDLRELVQSIRAATQNLGPISIAISPRLLDLRLSSIWIGISAATGVSASAPAHVSAGAGGSVSAGVSTSASAHVSPGVSVSAAGSASAHVDASAGAGGSFSAGGNVSARGNVSAQVRRVGHGVHLFAGCWFSSSMYISKVAV